MDHWYWWVGFGVFVVVMLALDLGVFHRKAHKVSVPRSAHLERRLDLDGPVVQYRHLFFLGR